MTSPLISRAPASTHSAYSTSKTFNYCCETCCLTIAQQDFSYSPINEFLYLAQRIICITVEDLYTLFTQKERLRHRQQTPQPHKHLEGRLCAQCISARHRSRYSWFESISENAYATGQLISLATSGFGAIAFGVMFLMQFLFPAPKRPQTPEEHVEALIKEREEEYQDRRRRGIAHAEYLDHLAEARRCEAWAMQAKRAGEYDRKNQHREDARRHKEEAEEKHRESQSR
jgi:hypothetical protein